MKCLFPATTALLVLCLFAACKTDNTDLSDNATDNAKIREHLVQVYGFSPESLEETDTDFIAEGDQLFAKATYWDDHGACDHEYLVPAAGASDSTASDRRHYRSAYLVDKYAWPTIKVNIDYTVPQSWRNAIVEAVQHWNNADGYFHFEVTYINYSVQGSINVKMSDILGSKTIAAAYNPTYKRRPGSPLTINSNFNYKPHSQKVFAMVHEIGHALGLRHTDVPDDPYSTQITNVGHTCRDYTDPYSVWQPYIADWDGFTFCDLQAYYAMYGW